ncbi:MAG: transporter substrate-binding domain-containing protein [Ignavibacteria bacterium]|nr:transporter substrate-binding domain-containing protein [Ignavibacteria bacterium]
MLKVSLMLLFLSTVVFSQKIETIVVGTGFYPPFSFNNEKGELDGYDYELGNKIAKELGKKIEWKQLPFKSLFSSLDEGKLDLIIAAIHITDERKKKYLFSTPYTNTGLVFIISAERRKEFEKIDDFYSKKIAAKEKSTGLEFVMNNKEKYKFIIEECAETDLCFVALENSRVDAIVSDYLSSRLYLKNESKFVIATPPFNLCGIGIVAKKKDAQLMKSINDVLYKLQKSNYLKNLYIKWLL